MMFRGLVLTFKSGTGPFWGFKGTLKDARIKDPFKIPFYRVEQSRTADKGGSGLGFAIAKGIVELQGGQIWAECSGEVIRFIVKLT